MATPLCRTVSHRRGHKTARLNSGVRLLKEDVRMSHKNLWLGLALLIAVYVALSNLATAIVPQTITAITVQPIVVWFLASFAGGLIARERFIFASKPG